MRFRGPRYTPLGAAAESVLRSHFESPLLQGAAVDVRVDDAQLRRAVVALRVLAPNAIRPIEDLVPLLYPGVKVSYGTIQQMLVEAEARAARFNAQASLGGVEAGALDEMFSQGEPVLAGVDLDSGYLFGLSLSATRDGEAWAELLREGQCQGLELSVVVKDAGAWDCRGGERGVSPGRAARRLLSCALRDEQGAQAFGGGAPMQRLNAREKRWGDWARYARTTRCAGAKPNANCRACGAGVPRPSSDSMSSRRRWTRCAGRWSVSTSTPVSCTAPEHVQALIEGAAQRIESLAVGECAKLAKYLRNRAPGLVLAQKERVAPARGVGRAVVGAGGELGVPVLVLGPGAAQASCARPASCAVSSSARRLRGTARPTWRGERIAARGRRGGAAPAPSRLECHRGVQCGTAPLSLCAQRCNPGLSRPVPCLVQSAHAALGTAQGDQCSRVPDRTAGPRLAHAARLSALADTALIHGRCRARALLGHPPDPEHCVPRDRPNSCV